MSPLMATTRFLAFTCATALAVPAAELPSPERDRIRAEVAAARRKLGDQAGLPETPDTFLAIPTAGAWLTAAEARAAFARSLPRLEARRWWQPGLDPTQLAHALREPAAVVSGCVHAYRAGLAGGDRALGLAREAADFLLWAQAEAGTGVFPFPAVRGRTGNAALAAADRFLRQAEKDGRLDRYVHRGWVVDDGADGGLQFDNAEAGVALLELFEVTQDERYLASARRAGDWAAAHGLVRNWNYNSFSVHLLARLHAVTGEPRYLASARHKALVGVIPGQLTDGPRAGRWLDPHNARPAYHYIMLRALAQLISTLPADDAARPEILAALRQGLAARNQDFIGPGAPNKDKAMEALLLVHAVFAPDRAFLRATLSDRALDALGRLVSDQYRRGGEPLGPREWGQFLRYVVEKPMPAGPPQ